MPSLQDKFCYRVVKGNLTPGFDLMTIQTASGGIGNHFVNLAQVRVLMAIPASCRLKSKVIHTDHSPIGLHRLGAGMADKTGYRQMRAF